MLQIRQSIKQVPINLDFSRKMKDHKENLMTWKENKYKIREVEAASSSLVIPIIRKPRKYQCFLGFLFVQSY